MGWGHAPVVGQSRMRRAKGGGGLPVRLALAQNSTECGNSQFEADPLSGYGEGTNISVKAGEYNVLYLIAC